MSVPPVGVVLVSTPLSMLQRPILQRKDVESLTRSWTGACRENSSPLVLSRISIRSRRVGVLPGWATPTPKPGTWE